MAVERIKTEADLERFVEEQLSRTPVSQLSGLDEAVLPTAWQEGELENEWEPYGDANYEQGAFYRRSPGGLITLKGLVTAGAGAAGTTIFTLPPQCRPPKNLVLFAPSSNGIERVTIVKAGQVLYGGVFEKVEWLALDLTMFWAAS
jgi:hypothetical protein